jgi:hypothetical protein
MSSNNPLDCGWTSGVDSHRISKEVSELNGPATIVLSNPFFVNAGKRSRRQGMPIYLRRRHPVKGCKVIAKSLKLSWLKQDVWIFDGLVVIFAEPSKFEISSVFFRFIKVPTLFEISNNRSSQFGW